MRLSTLIFGLPCVILRKTKDECEKLGTEADAVDADIITKCLEKID